jgi:hypothetical protein
VPGHFYAEDAMAFVRRVARMVIKDGVKGSAGEPARQHLNLLIAQARAICSETLSGSRS